MFNAGQPKMSKPARVRVRSLSVNGEMVMAACDGDRAVNENRIGRFMVCAAMLRDERYHPSIRAVMAQVVIVRAESLFHVDCVEYTGYSPHFAPVPESQEIPRYGALVHAKDDGAFDVYWDGDLRAAT